MTMKIRHYRDVAPDPAGEAGADGVTIRWVIGRPEGAANFSMRVIAVGPGGHTPFHRHPWEHEVFVLSGAGFVVQEEGESSCRAGDVVFIGPGEAHQFRNPADDPLEFICLIPISD
jgi:quercetin dioxygenase-like cupin family protein